MDDDQHFPPYMTEKTTFDFFGLLRLSFI